MSMSELARSDSYDPNAVDWSRLNQPFGTLLDPNPVLHSAAGGAVQIRPSDIDQATNMAMGFSGGGLSTKPIRAYHGSPHDFDRFDLSKIGTGEGAQVYGHGLYFAENEATAKAYREALAGKNTLADYNAQLKALSKEMEQYSTGQYGKYSDPRGYELKRQYDAVMDARAADKGHMYEVNINADPAHFLDWDKPLAAQTPDVQQRLGDVLRWQKVPLKNNVGEGTTGGQLVDYLERRFGNKIDPTGEFREVGIPGIKYLDQGSRNLGDVAELQRSIARMEANFSKNPENKMLADMLDTTKAKLAQAQQGTSNYVVFNDKLIDILRKYGLAGVAPAGMGALAAQDQYQPEGGM